VTAVRQPITSDLRVLSRANASAAVLAAKICRSEKDDPDLQAAADAATETAAELDALADSLPDSPQRLHASMQA
jgi:hypothetical protein